MPICIRPLADPDLRAADEVLASAFGGGSRLDDLHFYRRIQPDGWFVAETDGRLVGMVGAAIYGTLAHIGLMAVRPECQRQGIGRGLMVHLLAWLDAQVPLVTLDASKAGQPLYEKLGFIPSDETYTFQRAPLDILPPAPALTPITPAEVDEIVQADKLIFCADRGKLFRIMLQNFPNRAFLLRDSQGHLDGYVFAQPSRIGPWGMVQPEKAETLLQAALALPYVEDISLAVPSSNLLALELLQRYGFQHVRTNRRMVRGVAQDPCQREKIFSQTSLAVG